MALTRLCPFCLEPLTACICPDSDPPAAAPCCDLHGRNCEPEEPCCENCTEARHFGWTDEHGARRFGHPSGEACSSPLVPPADGTRM